jgi:hypothetical protein
MEKNSIKKINEGLNLPKRNIKLELKNLFEKLGNWYNVDVDIEDVYDEARRNIFKCRFDLDTIVGKCYVELFYIIGNEMYKERLVGSIGLSKFYPDAFKTINVSIEDGYSKIVHDIDENIKEIVIYGIINGDN